MPEDMEEALRTILDHISDKSGEVKPAEILEMFVGGGSEIKEEDSQPAQFLQQYLDQHYEGRQPEKVSSDVILGNFAATPSLSLRRA